MSTATPGLTSFTSGELSTRLAGRIDLKYYAQGCDTLVNFVNLPHGGVQRRSGFRFVHLAGNQTAASLLVPFEYNTEQSYILEFYKHTDGHGRMRIYKDQGIVVTAPNAPYELAIPFEPEDFAELRWVQNNDTIYFAHPSYAPRTLTRSAHTNWTFATPALSGQPEVWGTGNWPSRVCFFESRLCYASTPKQPNTLWFSQTRNYTDFRLNTREVPLTGWATCPIIDTNADGSKNGKDGDTFLLPKGKIFSSNSVDLVAVKGSNASGETAYFRYTGAKRFDAASADKTITFKLTGATGDQIEAATLASNAGLNSTYWEQWAPGDRRTNDEGVPLADDAIETTLDASQPQAIAWLLPKERLWAGTRTSPWTIGGASASEGMSPDSIKASRHGTCGSSNVEPIDINASTLFVQRGQQRVREMAYDFQTDSFVTPDKNILSDHILKGLATRLVYVQDPDSVVYVAKGDGTIANMTYMPEQDVQGWANTETDGDVESIASVFGSVGNRTELWAQFAREVDGVTVRTVEFLEGPHEGDTTVDAFFVDSGLTYDGTNADTTHVFSLTGSGYAAGSNGTITATGHAPFTSNAVGSVYGLQASNSGALYDATARRYRVEITSFTSSNACGCTFLDAIPAALQSNATPAWAALTQSVTGLDHLNGGTVQVLLDGAVHPDVVVASNGSIALTSLGAVVHAGLGYTSTLRTMKLEAGSEFGTSQTKNKVVTKLNLRFLRTVGGKAGVANRNGDNLGTLAFRTQSDHMDAPPPLYTGDKEIRVSTGWTKDCRLVVVQDQPLPMTVLMMVPVVTTNE